MDLKPDQDQPLRLGREALAVLAWGLVPAVLTGVLVWMWVHDRTLADDVFSPIERPWVAQVERHLLVPVETAAGLTAALGVFVAVAVVRAWRRRGR